MATGLTIETMIKAGLVLLVIVVSIAAFGTRLFDAPKAIISKGVEMADWLSGKGVEDTYGGCCLSKTCVCVEVVAESRASRDEFFSFGWDFNGPVINEDRIALKLSEGISGSPEDAFTVYIDNTGWFGKPKQQADWREVSSIESEYLDNQIILTGLSDSIYLIKLTDSPVAGEKRFNPKQRYIAFRVKT